MIDGDPVGSTIRATIGLGHPTSAPVLERGFSVRWDPGAAGPEVRLEVEEVKRLSAFVEALPKGKIDYGMIRAVAPALGRFLDAGPLATSGPACDLVELVAGEATPLLTEVPWEAAARGSDPLPEKAEELFGRLLASLPVCRLVEAAPRAVAVSSHRPRLLLCISNPPGIDGGQIAVRSIQSACEQVLELYPVFQVKTVSGPLTWPAVAPIIRRFQPNMFVFIGHGSSDPGGPPTLAFVRDADRGGVDRRSVVEVAEALADGRPCGVVVLIACDLVRASGYSAACELVGRGVNEVLAMQGSVQQQCARIVLTTLLAELLAGATLPSAAAAARHAARHHPHAILPAVFRASERGRGPSELAPLATLYDRALGALYTRVHEPRAMLARPGLQARVEEILAHRGVAAVGGAFGNGSSVVLRAAVASSLKDRSGRRSRPVIYIDCDRRPGDLPLAQWVSYEILTAASAHPVLRPKASPDFAAWSKSGEQVGIWTAEAEISIVLDNVPFHATADDQAFVEGFCNAYRRPDSRAVLVLGGAGELLEFVDEPPARVVIPALSQAETDAYVETFKMSAADPRQLYSVTGGTLLLLDAERRLGGGPHIPGPRPPVADTLTSYLDRLDEWLSPSAREASSRLALFHYPLDLRLVERLLTPDLPGAVTELVEAGLAVSFEERGATWALIPERKSRGLRQRRAADLEEAQEKLATNLAERYEQDADGLVRAILSWGGASTYLHVVQRCLAEAGQCDIAVALPVLAQGSTLSAIDLFELFEESVRILHAADFADADVLLAGARAALNVGKLAVAERWLAQLPADLGSVEECRKLGLTAVLRKDQGQAQVLADILADYAKATDVAARAPAEHKAECERLRYEIVMDSLPAAMFLARESAASAAARLGSVLPQVPPQEQALLLATLAEREMKEPTDRVDWTRVAEWVTQATSKLGADADERVRTYCAYQQAQYLRQRPEPRRADAWRVYEEARAAGQRAGEHRRTGLALLRLIELERADESLQQEPAAWPARRIEELDDIVAHLRSALDDALSMRVLGRLQSLAAALDLDDGRKRDRLTQAAWALANRTLSVRSDDLRFAEVCLLALRLDLGSGGDFLLAQRFLASFRSEISRRLGIPADLERPEATRDAIAHWLASRE